MVIPKVLRSYLRRRVDQDPRPKAKVVWACGEVKDLTRIVKSLERLYWRSDVSSRVRRLNGRKRRGRRRLSRELSRKAAVEYKC